MLFNKFYAATPVCSPSRASFISGLYPQHAGVPSNNKPMRDSVITAAKVLSLNDYKTGFIGKWHLDGKAKPGWEPERDFGFSDNRYMFNRGHWKKLEDTEQGPRIVPRNEEGKPIYKLDGADSWSFTTDFLTNRAIDFISESKKSPFFLYLSFPDPHGPDKVRAPYDSMYTNMEYQAPKTYHVKREDAPGWAKPSKKAEIDQSQYFGMVKCIDDNVGRLVDHLREEGLLDNTIVVFTSDHGDLRAEHHRHDKGNPFEASAKVPFIVYYPSKIPTGTVVNKAFSTVDFSPAILSFLGMEVPPQMQGRDFSELLENPEKQEEWEDIVFSRASGKGNKGNWVAAITSRYKLVIGKNGKHWLFDTEEDPDELINFINDPEKAEVVKELAKRLYDYSVEFSDPYLDGTSMGDDLKALLERE
ncbi:MAG: sulfatase-like hydrolase/transferase, partial [Bacteroidota bacterium]